MDGGITSKVPAIVGIHCRTVKDAVSVLDAIKGYESADMFTAIPKALIPKEPYASFVVADKDVKNKPLKGMRSRHRPRVHGEAHEERRGDQRPDRQGDQEGDADTLGASSSSRWIRCIPTIPPCPT